MAPIKVVLAADELAEMSASVCTRQVLVACSLAWLVAAMLAVVDRENILPFRIENQEQGFSAAIKITGWIKRQVANVEWFISKGFRVTE
jgi:hypothetical protein